MSPVITKIISVAGMNLIAIIISKRITKSQIKLFTLKNLGWFLFSLIPILIFQSVGYNFTTFLTFFFLILSIKKILEIDIIISTILVLFIMILSTIPDLLGSAIIMNFISFTEIHDNFLILCLTSIFVSIITYYIFMTPFVKKIVNLSIDKLQKQENRRVIIYLLFAFIAICIMYYTTSSIFTPTKDYFVANLVILSFIFLIFIYMNEIMKYDKLLMQNNTLYECMQNVENYQEQQDLCMHEYKNQLSKVIDATTDEKVINIVKSILKIDSSNENYILGKIKYLPKGEIKSLIYYKLLVSNKQNLNESIDISPKIKEEDLKLPSNVNNELSQLIGIYFDNAIEAAYNSSKKQIALEVYKIKDSLFFVITNSYKGNIKLNNITKKGFSTKGNSRGKGLYFANKIVKNSTYFNNETKIIDDYFIQKLEVRKK